MSTCHSFAMSAPPTVLSALDQFIAAHPDWFVGLDSARSSAHKCSFRHPRDTAALLAKLIDYRRLMIQYGDAEARKVFGNNEYAAHESSTIRNNKNARNARTFYYDGVAIFMEHHIKIGHKDFEAESTSLCTLCRAGSSLVTAALTSR